MSWLSINRYGNNNDNGYKSFESRGPHPKSIGMIESRYAVILLSETDEGLDQIRSFTKANLIDTVDDICILTKHRYSIYLNSIKEQSGGSLNEHARFVKLHHLLERIVNIRLEKYTSADRFSDWVRTPIHYGPKAAHRLITALAEETCHERYAERERQASLAAQSRGWGS